jgi:hypothetical protein
LARSVDGRARAAVPEGSRLVTKAKRVDGTAIVVHAALIDAERAHAALPDAAVERRVCGRQIGRRFRDVAAARNDRARNGAENAKQSTVHPSLCDESASSDRGVKVSSAGWARAFCPTIAVDCSNGKCVPASAALCQ